MAHKRITITMILAGIFCLAVFPFFLFAHMIALAVDFMKWLLTPYWKEKTCYREGEK